LRNLAGQKQKMTDLAYEKIGAQYRMIRDEIIVITKDLPAGMKRSILAGFDRSSPASEQLVHDYTSTYADSYKHLTALYDILDWNEGKFTVNKDSFVTFQDSQSIGPYNQELADLRRDAANLVKIQDKMLENQKAGIMRIINSTK
jgi:hypothetical protein